MLSGALPERSPLPIQEPDLLPFRTWTMTDCAPRPPYNHPLCQRLDSCPNDEVSIVSILLRVHYLHSGAHLHCLSGICRGVVVEDFHRFHVVGPYTNGTGPSCLAVVVMAGIANGQPNIVLLDEVNRFLKVGCVGGVDGVGYIISQRTRSVLGEEWVADVVGKVRSHDGR